MNTPLPVLPLSLGAPSSYRRKRILLVDASTRKRDLRSEVMRKLEIDVDCAADIGEARCWWKADFYDLVLIDMEKGRGHRDEFCDYVRGTAPAQRMAFLVGEPDYLAGSPRDDQQLTDQNVAGQFVLGEIKAVLAFDLKDATHRWGILAASRKISAVRSACTARTRAMQERYTPPRELDVRPSKRMPAPTLDDLLRQETQ
jgi:CheY-like chemotaxis protein